MVGSKARISLSKYIIHGDGYWMVHYFVEQGQSDFPPPVCKVLPTEVLEHRCNTAAPAIVIENKADGSNVSVSLARWRSQMLVQYSNLEQTRDIYKSSLSLLVQYLKLLLRNRRVEFALCVVISIWTDQLSSDVNVTPRYFAWFTSSMISPHGV